VRAAVVCALLAACGGAQKPARGVGSNDAIVQLRSNVRDAQVYVDGRFVASLDAIGGGVAVEPGTHRFELRRDDFFSAYLELTLARAERKKVVVEMLPVLP
jgi:hypothetical protein